MLFLYRTSGACNYYYIVTNSAFGVPVRMLDLADDAFMFGTSSAYIIPDAK